MVDMWGEKARVYSDSLGKKKAVAVELRITTPG
jgi:hypothetical protein